MYKQIAFLLILILCSTSIFAQKKKAAKSGRPTYVIVTGKPLSPADSAIVENLFYEGLKNKTTGNIALALANFIKIIAYDPQNHHAYYEIAQIYFSNRDFLKAQENIEKAITVKQDNEWYWVLAANVYQELKKADLLSYALDELIKLSPQKIEYGLEKALTLLILEKPQEALKVYNTLEKQYGVSPDIVEGKQQVYRIIGDYKNAEEDLLKLINEDSLNVKYYIFLGDLYFNNNEKSKALEAYKKVKELDSRNGYVNLALSDIYNAEGKTEEAFIELTQAFRYQEINIDQKIKVVIGYFSMFPDLKYVRYAETLSYILTEEHPDDAKSFAVYGDVLFQKEEYEKAREAYEQSVHLNKNIYAVWEQLVRINLSMDDMEKVVKSGEEALTYFPNSPYLYLYTAMGLSRLKQDEKAVSYLNNALNFDLDKQLKTTIYGTLGDVYQNMKKYKESAQAYETAIEIEPNNVYALNNYAYYLSLRNEDLDKAEKMSIKSNQISPGNSSFLDTYAWILFKQKKYKEAKEWIEEAMKASKEESGVIVEHYGDILYHLDEKEEAVLNWKKAKKLGEHSDILDKKINEKKYAE